MSNRLILIVGGGAVAVRKARGVLEAGATRVRCIAPDIHDQMPAGVDRIVEEFSAQHLDGAGLVFAATDCPEVNDNVVRECRVRGILVNRADADEAEPGDFVNPAKWEEGSVIVAVSAGSAALSAAVRDHVARGLDRRYVKMATAMQALRPAIRASKELEPSRRPEVFRALAGEEALAVLDTGGIEALRQWIGRRFPEISHG